jgi:FKBP-type peptidyl-prolyl cis-trans isomerase 2
VVEIEYTLRDDDGEVIDSSSRRRGTLHYLHGQGQIVPGLGARCSRAASPATRSRRWSVAPEEGYGPHFTPTAW